MSDKETNMSKNEAQKQANEVVNCYQTTMAKQQIEIERLRLLVVRLAGAITFAVNDLEPDLPAFEVLRDAEIDLPAWAIDMAGRIADID